MVLKTVECPTGLLQVCCTVLYIRLKGCSSFVIYAWWKGWLHLLGEDNREKKSLHHLHFGYIYRRMAYSVHQREQERHACVGVLPIAGEHSWSIVLLLVVVVVGGGGSSSSSSSSSCWLVLSMRQEQSPQWKLPQHTLCDSHSLCRPAYNMKSVILDIAKTKSPNTCSIRLWTSQWGGQRSRAPARPPKCSSGSWPDCCCKPSRAGALSVAWLNRTIPFWVCSGALIQNSVIV